MTSIRPAPSPIPGEPTGVRPARWRPGTARVYHHAMNDAMREPPDNLVELDLSAFSHADLDKILELGKKQRLLYRWFRCERKTESGLDFYQVYSGARGRTPYAAYRIERRRDGRYWLLDERTAEIIAQARTLDAVIKRLPENFFYST